MGLIRNAFKKLFISSKTSNVSKTKLLGIVYGLTAIGVWELCATDYRNVTGDSSLNVKTQVSELFSPTNDVEFENNKACKGKNIETIVENNGSRIGAPKFLHSEECRMTNVLWTNKAREEFLNLNNKSKFTIKFTKQGKYQKIHRVADAGFTKSVAISFSTLNVRNSCVSHSLETYCGMPNLVRGIYDASILVNADNQIIDIYQIYKRN